MYTDRFNSNREQQPIDVTRYASVVATAPSTLVSDKYKFIPTTTALKVLADYGWFPVGAKQAGTRMIEKQGFQKHAVRLVNQQLNKELCIGSTVPQLALTNSHSGGSCFELAKAIFEKICMNGMWVAKSSQDMLKIQHRGYSDLDLAKAIETVARQIPQTMERIEEFKQITLEPEERTLFAKAAIDMRFDGDQYTVDPSSMLYTYRAEEKAPTLWNTFNIVQERVIRGGVRQTRKDGSRIRSREVKGLDQDVKLNRALWSLAEGMANLKQGKAVELQAQN